MDAEQQKKLQAMYRRWIYMVIAIVASAILPSQKVFSFQDDKGIIYVRSFSIDEKTFYVTQTELATGAEEITETMSIAGLYYCAKAMLVICVLCFCCFFSMRGRMVLAILAAILAGAYYILMVYYAVRITDDYFATLYPTIMAVLPAIVLQMMLLVRRNVTHDAILENTYEEKDD